VNPACPSDASRAYQAAPRSIPGTIEAEDFDPAGTSDSTPGNEGGAYRTDVDVDIKTQGAGFAVGWMTAGEWLEYTVDVQAEGDYDVVLQVSAVDPGRTLELSSCGTSLTGPIAIPQIAAWGDMATTTVGPIHLTAGLQVIRVTVGSSDYIDFDSMTFQLHAGGGAGGAPGAGGAGAGAGGAGAGGAQTCDLRAPFRWSSTGPLITPKSPAGRNFVSIKDPTIVNYQGTYHVFATVYDGAAGSGGWKSVYLNFTDFAQADSAPQSSMATWSTGSTVAPQVFFFAPQNKWYLIYQWGARYSTNDDINNPNGWSTPKPLLSGEPSGALDFWTICDDANCHLFFSRDDGTLYRSKTSLANFPAFSGYEVVMSDPQVGRLFEASNVYKIEGTNRYLLMVEAYGPRYFRSWTSTSLDGPWTPLADTQQNPFAGQANVTFSGAAWTNDISHGEMIRAGYDQTMVVNACRLQFLYQGVDPNAQVSDYGLLPYRLGLLTQTN